MHFEEVSRMIRSQPCARTCRQRQIVTLDFLTVRDFVLRQPQERKTRARKNRQTATLEALAE